MILCDVIRGVISTFKDVVVASRESLFLYKNEKDELGIQTGLRKKEQSGNILFLNLYSVSLRYQIIIYTGICEE